MKIQWPIYSPHKSFASDNNSGIHPDILKAMDKANKGHFVSYGDDPYTEEARNIFHQIFGKQTETYFVYNGTGANITGLSSLVRSFHSILTSDTAHITCDECGSPEKMMGCTVKTVPNKNGKISPSQLKSFLPLLGIEHHSQPKIISITQATELGTVYTVEEMKELCSFAHENHMFVHVDGARIANAAVTLEKSLKEITIDCGVDVLSFGGTKNGLAYGEAIVFASSELCHNTKFIRKQNAQLASKMRFISSQFLAYFEKDLWWHNAKQANTMAKLLERSIITDLPELTITQPVESNAVFLKIPCNKAAKMQAFSFFYPWDATISEYRWMTSFDTSEEDIHDFVHQMKKSLLNKTK